MKRVTPRKWRVFSYCFLATLLGMGLIYLALPQAPVWAGIVRHIMQGLFFFSPFVYLGSFSLCWRCTYCMRLLPSNTFYFISHCPYCGKELE